MGTGFMPLVSYPVAVDSLAVGDFNGDGHVDIVAADWGNGVNEGSASVLLNRGDGSLATPSSYAASLEPASVAVGDFNSDGRLDFIVTNVLRDLDLFVNLGGGAFAPRVRLNGTEVAVVMTAGDFNRDDHPDLVLTTQSRRIAVLLGDGAGGFAAEQTYPTGINVNSVASADFNRDGYPDLVVSNAEFDGGCPGTGMLCLPRGLAAGTVNVFLNQGDGSFAPQVTYPSGKGTQSVSAGDLDGDGAPDIAATNSVDDTLSVFFNIGDGSFGAPVTYANAGSGTSALGVPFSDRGGGVAATDVDGDGHVDVLIVRGSSQDRGGEILVLRNQGDGRLGAPITFLTKVAPKGFALADFNGDGLPDVAMTMVDGTLGVVLSSCR